jgi:hypothetical protein
MHADSLAAIAAIGSTCVGVVNIAAVARLARRQDGTKWTREQLPQVIYDLDKAFHEYYMALFKADWTGVEESARESVGRPEYRNVQALAQRLVTVASRDVNRLAFQVLVRLEEMRFFFLEQPTDQHHEGRWPLYWAYADAEFLFVNAARRGMGLKPLDAPPNSAGYRARRNPGRIGRLNLDLSRRRQGAEPTPTVATPTSTSPQAEATQELGRSGNSARNRASPRGKIRSAAGACIRARRRGRGRAGLGR